MKKNFRKFIIVTGHYGSGKTNFSANLAVALAREGKKVCVTDLDIVNPYFRSADFSELFSSEGVELAAPMYANTNLDIPAISFDIESMDGRFDHVIIDTGGDDTGAVALKRYSNFFNADPERTDALCVVNMYRYLTETPEEAAGYVAEIEYASGVPHTGIVNNSNLGEETVAETVEKSAEYARRVSELTGKPIIFNTDSTGNAHMENIFPIKVYVEKVWQI